MALRRFSSILCINVTLLWQLRRYSLPPVVSCRLVSRQSTGSAVTGSNNRTQVLIPASAFPGKAIVTKASIGKLCVELEHSP